MAPRTGRTAQRAALLELGASVAEEMRAGQGGQRTGSVGEALAAMPDATLEIVGLIGREARRRRPDQHLVAALAYMVGQALEGLRYGVERDDPEAAAMLEAVRRRLVAEARSDRADPAVLTLLARQFAIARLDVGDELRDAMGGILAEEAEAAAEAGDAGLDMERHLADLGRELGDDPFAIHAELSETASPFPIEHRLAMASFMLGSEAAAVREAALGWLFDPAAEVRTTLAEALLEEAAVGRLGPVTLRRLVVLRNWMPQPDREAIDAAVRLARRKGAEPQPIPPVAIEAVRMSAFDGSGAASAFALVKAGRHCAVVSMLFKLGHGLRDAWVHRGLTRAEAEAEMGHVASEIELVALAPLTLHRILSHAFALHGATLPPPFAAVDVVEALGFGALNPEPLAPDAIVDEILAHAGDAALDIASALTASGEWTSHYGFMQSWFEDDAAVDEAFKGRKGLSRTRRIDLVLDRVIVPRRRRWGEMLAWTALITVDDDDPGEAVAFAAVAREVMGERPAVEIPLLRAIATATLDARRQRRV